MKKIIAALMILSIVPVLFACSRGGAPTDDTIIGGADGSTDIIVSDDFDNDTADSTDDTAPVISDKQAIEITKNAIITADFSEFGMDSARAEDFELRSCELDAEFFSEMGRQGNPVWTVIYDYTPSVCDCVYYNVDSVTGEILHFSWMGD